MWLRSLRPFFVFLAVGVVSCGGGDADPPVEELGPGAESPQAAVRELVSHLNAPDFNAASALAVPNQAALASLAEGATFTEVADAIRSGDPSVAANFWAGFAQGAGTFLVGEVTTGEGETIEKEGVTFHEVIVIPEEESSRKMMAQETEGYRIDLFASFGAGLADKMIPPVDRLLSANTDDASLILGELRRIVPSLLIAVEQPGLQPAMVQQLLQLVELITRVN